jgi:hypothetical protein
MNIAQPLLDDLARIGATIAMAEDRLVLRAGSTAIPGTLVRRIREAKPNLMAALAARKDRAASRTHADRQCEAKQPSQESVGRTYRDRTPESLIIQWLDEHPASSPAGLCAWCGRPESMGAMVVPFGTEPGTHTWLHPECWSPWHRARTVEASTALGLTRVARQRSDERA